MAVWLPIVLGALLCKQATSVSDTQMYVPACHGVHTMDCYQQENVVLRERIYTLRQHLGLLSCKHEGIGPTGGFCLDENNAAVGGNNFMDEPLAAFLLELFEGHDLLDLGCGLGQYGTYFEQHGILWQGFDGAENVEAVTQGHVKWLDLTVPQWLDRQWDWVMSLEVGEHLAAEYEATFVDNLVRHSRCGIVLSWAEPGQGGHHHVNLQNNTYVEGLLATRGFDRAATPTNKARSVATIEWLKHTVQIFKKRHGHC